MVVTSPHRSHLASQYSLTWEAVSLLRVLEYRLLYRPVRQGGEQWTNIIPTLQNKNSRLR